MFVFCNCWLPVVTGDITAPLLYKNEINAATACTFFSKHLILIDFCNFWLSVVIGALLASSLHQHELNASTACSFSKHLILMVLVKTQPSVVIGARLPIS